MRGNQMLLEVSSLHIYTSALFWHKPESLISAQYLGKYVGEIPRIIWGLDRSRVVNSLFGHRSPVEAIAFSPSGEYITSISEGGKNFPHFTPKPSIFHVIQWDA